MFTQAQPENLYLQVQKGIKHACSNVKIQLCQNRIFSNNIELSSEMPRIFNFLKKYSFCEILFLFQETYLHIL